MRLLTPDTASDYSNFFFSIKGAQEYWDMRTTQLRDGVVLTMEEIVDAFNNTVGIRGTGNASVLGTYGRSQWWLGVVFERYGNEKQI